MNDLCIITWVYGRKYQGWIPLYLYSIKKNYPEYGVRILVENALNPEIKSELQRFGIYHQEEIIENCMPDIMKKSSDIEKRCWRWLVDAGKYAKGYKYIYIGDIDMFIVKEEPQLIKQHVMDIDKNNKVYSNAIRLKLLDYLIKKGNKTHLLRLTGLHFVKAETYFNRVRLAQKIVLSYLEAEVNVRWLDNLFFQDDERCLWLINFLAGLKEPKESYELDDNVFRPLHGVHFAVGREYQTYKQIMDGRKKKEHCTYFEEFKKEYNSDSRLRDVIWNSPIYIIDIIIKLCHFWENQIDEEGISTK